ncbi:hypothetical protein GKD14_11880 [Paeniclostridium sordellii]|nr:hypothetical protein [Paeniclostridium sordellii]MSB59642.1 hypothetical protein [Paeniclostridium sordellii]
MESTVWLDELDEKRQDLEKLATEICEFLKSIYNQQGVKVIITHRIKGRASLSEKIKRNSMENELNKGKKVFEVFNDLIGIRILCMKISDEKLVYDSIIKNKDDLLNKNILFNEIINKQPVNQKNGHVIYKFDGVIINNESQFQFEVQIKSLANLFWGEMEHLLFYKNSKVLISNKYYQKEIDSIYEELRNIDKKLTYMEEAMMSESKEDLLEEKIEVFKRYAYLQLKESLKKEFGEELNNKYIFNAVGDYIFRAKNRNSTNSDEILRKSLFLLLDSNTQNLDFSKFNFEGINDIKIDRDIKNILNEIIKERKNGWWIYIVLSGILSFHQNNEYNIQDVDYNLIRNDIDQCMRNLCNIINKEVNLYTKIIEINSEYATESIKKITLSLVKKFLEYCKISKNLKFTNRKYAENYNDRGIELLISLQDKNLDILDQLCEDEEFIEVIHSILINTDSGDRKITNQVKHLNNQICKKIGMSLDEIELYFKTNDEINVDKFFNIIGGGNNE